MRAEKITFSPFPEICPIAEKGSNLLTNFRVTCVPVVSWSWSAPDLLYRHKKLVMISYQHEVGRLLIF